MTPPAQRPSVATMNVRRVVLAGGALAALLARPRLRSWGATCEERRMPLPGDGLIPGERDVTTMATTIAAPPEAVWPWLAQMGWDRAGWYSFDRLDRGGHPSAEVVDPAWTAIREGDRLFSLPDQRCWFDVVHCEPGRSLVLRAALDSRGRPYGAGGRRPRWFNDSRWEFFLIPLPGGATRLLVRSGGAARPRAAAALTNLAFWHPAHLVMQLRQFQGLRRRAEGAMLHDREVRHAAAGGMIPVAGS